MLGKLVPSFVVVPLLILAVWAGPVLADDDEADPQYELGDVSIPAATADEAFRADVSAAHGATYLETGALYWSREKGCVSCHTNGSYMRIRPALTPHLGPPSEEVRTFFISAMGKLKKMEREKQLAGIRPTQIAYVAAGLAEWDAHVGGQLSPETDEALKLMFSVQSDNGEWGNTDCWPPFESSAYHGTTVAAMAAATAPGWLTSQDDPKILESVERMKKYLRTQEPPHDYGRLLLLWTSTRIDDLLSEKQRQDLVESVWKHQRADGGWSIRTFAAPDAWGSGKRAEKLKQEADFENPASDGHQTGLAVLVLRDAGVPAKDNRLQKAVKWLLANQKASGRWWTRSLNTDGPHYITFSATGYSLLALAKCDALPKLTQKTAAK